MAPKKKDVAEPKILLGRPKQTLKMGLVGLPNVGKSTTFNFLSNQSVPAENFPFCTIEPHEARMNVPDSRFDWLCDHFKPKSMVPATLAIFDIAGLVRGAHKGEGLGNSFLSHIDAVDGIFHIVRAFDDPEVIHNEGEINPIADMDTISDELRLKDIDRVTKLIDDLRKSLERNAKDKRKHEELAVLESCKAWLEDKKWISAGNWKMNEIDILNEFHFLTAKSVVYLVNMSEKDYAKQKNKWLKKIAEYVGTNVPGPIIPYSAAFESKLQTLETPDEKSKYMESLGTTKSMVDKIINTGFSTLNLIYFFTSGEDEVKAWSIRRHTKAPQAAGTIHTDFERGFICADVYKCEDLKECGSENAVKAAGKYHQKGKDYVVEDGDVIFFKFNVAPVKKKK